MQVERLGWLVQHALRHAAVGSLAGMGHASSLLAPPTSLPASAAALSGTLLRLLHTSLCPPYPAPASHLPIAAAATVTEGNGTGQGAAAQQARSMHSAAAAASQSLGRGRKVAVGISGGVDSAVAAMLLQRQGYEVVGVFMRNWDEGEEVGNQNCSVERDLRDASAVCRQLGIPLHEADFVSAYWNQVFSDFLAQCGRGLTPNPDLACNRHIKFDALLTFAGQLGAQLVATGHYARLAHASSSRSSSSSSSPPTNAVRLLRGADRLKDQTYFLASVQPAALQRVLFPVGHLQKAEVRRMAAEAGLATADKRSSAGICFIGRRNFAAFLGQYIPPQPGRYVDVGSGATLGPCPDLAAVTHGQRPGIGGAADRVYAVGKDVVDRVVYVAQGRDHPALLCSTALLRTPHWLSVEHAQRLAAQGWLSCQYKARYGQDPKPCTIHALDQQAAARLAQAAGDAQRAAAGGKSGGSGGDNSVPAATTPAAVASPTAAAAAAAGPEVKAVGTAMAAEDGVAGAEEATAAAAARLGFRPSAYCRLQPQDSAVLPSYLVVRFEEPGVAITPQQACVLYDGELCLGSALIVLPGRSVHEEAADSGCAPQAAAAE